MDLKDTIYQAIYSKLLTIANFKGSDGTTRVYQYEKTNPDGFPAASLTNGTKTEDTIIDNARNRRTFFYFIRLYQEILNEDRGRQEGERIIRQLESTVREMFDADNKLSVAGVIRTRPIQTTDGYLEGGRIRVVDIEIAVETAVVVNS